MSLSSAKAKLDAQGGDPVAGYISKTDHQQSYDELVDDTALTGATTAEALDVAGALTAGTVASDATVAGTGLAGGLLSSANPVINGVAAPGTSAIPSRQDHVHASDTTKVTGPASATDNALVRFDGAGGKTVQNSGITVDDSGNVSSDLTVSKASPTLRVNATSGDSVVTIDGAAGSLRSVRFRTGTALRWFFGASSGAETGSEAGSDFRLRRYNDAAAGVSDPLYVWRNTGKVTFGDIGASAGLELGVSGPRVMSGTGSPEGVVTAPVGSRWIRTDGDTLGDFEYQKRSGTGSTGWVVADGDTGWRDITSLATANAGQTLADFMVRRIGGVVYLQAQFAQSTTNTVFELFANGTWPSGFNIPTQTDETVISGGRGSGSGYTASSLGLNTNAASVADVKYRVDNASYMYFHGSWPTSDAWPSSLPGSAA